MKKFSTWIWIALAIALDQLTKYAIRLNFAPCNCREMIPGLKKCLMVIPGFFDIVYVQNPGAAWGSFAGWRIPLIALAVAMLVFIAVKRNKIFGEGPLARMSFILLFGGIVGNMVDRTIFGFVTDFLDFYIGNSHFPSFNVADSCICIGVGLYMILNLRQSKQKKDAADTPAENNP